jgi:serine/threonine protein kinase
MEQKKKRSELPDDRSHDKRSHTERESEKESSLTSVKTGPELEVSTSSLTSPIRETDLFFYEFKRTLAPGNYGSVYLAKREPDNDLVAKKAIKIGVGYTNSRTLERECMKF